MRVDWKNFLEFEGSNGKVTYHNDKHKLIMYGVKFHASYGVRPRDQSASELRDMESAIRSKKVKIGRYNGK